MMEKILNNKWLKIGLLAVAGLILATGLVFAGYWYSQMSNLKTQISKPQLKTQNLSPTLTSIVSPLPTFSPEPSPSPDETAGWKTYTNEKWQFLIKFPPSFVVSDESPLLPFFLADVGFYPPERLQNFLISIIITGNESKYSALNYFEEVFRSKYNNQLGLSLQDFTTETTLLSGIEGVKITNKGNAEEGGSIFVLLPKKDKMFIFFLRKYPELEEKEKVVYQATFDLMLSTFKFLPSTSSGQGE